METKIRTLINNWLSRWGYVNINSPQPPTNLPVPKSEYAQGFADGCAATRRIDGYVATNSGFKRLPDLDAAIRQFAIDVNPKFHHAIAEVNKLTAELKDVIAQLKPSDPPVDGTYNGFHRDNPVQ